MTTYRHIQPRHLTAALAAVLMLAGVQSVQAAEPTVSISDTVTTALSYSPRLKVLQSNQQAISYERDRARAGYLPSLDLTAGYGTESYSDESTRAEGNDTSFYSRGEAALRLTQLLYDGSETSSRVGIEEAKLESAKSRVFDNAEAITLDAIIAHMEVYRQRTLFGLAEKNVRDHEEILGMLNERQKAGAGSIADVSQTEGRLARARASLSETRSTLKGAEANYQRVVGKLAGNLENLVIPADQAPKSLDEVVQTATANNPKVRALAHNVQEAEARVDLSKSDFLPKVNLELSHAYTDQVESNESWELGSSAMVRLRWNLFNGLGTVADDKAAVARKAQAASSKDDQLVQVVEEAASTWAKLESARQEVIDYGKATASSEKTLDYYMKQFNVGQRTLLDVLDARNELFQSSGLLVTAKVNEVIAVERLLALEGKLNESLQVDRALYAAAE